MRQAQAKFLRADVFRYCEKTRHPFPKRVLRLVKRLYNQTPRHLRNRFSVAQGKVV